MIKCVTNKKVYATQEMAEDMLIEAHTQFDYVPNNGPIAVYKCDDCGYYHLTSKGEMNPKLSQYLASKKSKIDKEASRWTDKFKRK
jgi:hypothetical protein